MNSITVVEMLLGVFQILMLVWPVWLVICVMIVGRLVRKLYMNRRFKQAGMLDIDRLTGHQFEQYLQFLFEKLGFKTHLTPSQGDFGADLIIERDGLRMAVQAKRFNGTVGVGSVQQVVAAMPVYECNRAMVVTNSYFSQQAKELAKANNVELWDRKKLKGMALSLHKIEPTPPLSSIAESLGMTNSLLTSPSQAGKQPPISEPIQTDDCCKTCGIPVTFGVRRYCLDQPERFGGDVYCVKHQKLFTERQRIPATLSR